MRTKQKSADSDCFPTPSTRRVDPDNPGAQIIREAAAAIRNGGVVAFPTRCLYGLGADAFNAGAVERVFTIKQRPETNPLLLLIGSQKDVHRLVRHVPAFAACLMDYFWPGKITLVFEAGEQVPQNLTAGTGKIGLRLPAHPVARALVQAAGGPITGTSANISGAPGCADVSRMNPAVAGQLDLILDAGPLKGGAGSTVVDVTGSAPLVLREGEVGQKDILSVLAQSQSFIDKFSS
ncbi:MAG: L-threonylcarbamoyladenylate synthase [Desulfobacterales bacterium]|nr:L-threonylcarbamoyladenylate synthase [Desulfobacterales bacterium]